MTRSSAGGLLPGTQSVSGNDANCRWEKKQTKPKQHLKRREQIIKHSLTATLSGKVFLNGRIPASEYLIFFLSFAGLSHAASVGQRTASAGEVSVLKSSPSSAERNGLVLVAPTCLAVITLTCEGKMCVYSRRGRFLL